MFDLQGRTILVTRPLPEAESTARLIASANGQPLLAPCLSIHPPRDAGPLRDALDDATAYDAILITSANGARALVDAWSRTAPPPPLFAVGGKTARILEKKGWKTTVPEQAGDSGQLARTILEAADSGRRFLFMRAETGREELIHALREAGKRVDVVDAYRAEQAASLPGPVRAALAAGRVDAITFFSGRTATAFLDALPGEGRAWLDRPLLVTISPVTSLVLEQRGVRVDLTARTASSEGVIETLSNHWHPPAPPG